MDESVTDVLKRKIDEDNKINIKLHYPFNDKFEYVTRLERIDLDRERENDLRSGRGFIIDEFNSIKKDIKAQGGIFSIRYGSTLYDSDSFIDRYRCNCGRYKGSINHGIRCETCDSLCRYTDDDMGIFGWFVLKDDMSLNQEVLDAHPQAVETAYRALKELGIDGVSDPIRGGTDGAELSLRGLPCPNLGNGDRNCHGRYEYCVVEEMQLAAELIKKIVALIEEA